MDFLEFLESRLGKFLFIMIVGILLSLLICLPLSKWLQVQFWDAFVNLMSIIFIWSVASATIFYNKE